MDKPLVSWWSWFFVRWALMMTFVMGALLSIALAIKGPELDAKIKASRAEHFCCMATGPVGFANCAKLRERLEYKPFLPMRGWSVVLICFALVAGLGSLAAHEKTLKPQLALMPRAIDERHIKLWSMLRDMLCLGFAVLGLSASLLLVMGPLIEAKYRSELPTARAPHLYATQEKPKPISDARLWGALLGGMALLCGLGAAGAHEKLPKVRRDEAADEAGV